MNLLLAQPKIDAHMHVGGAGFDWGYSDDDMLRAADRLGIAKLCCSIPVTGNRYPEPDEVRACNDAVLAAMRRHPERILGYAYLHPAYHDAALDQARRCLDAGMIGFKFYHQYRADEPVCFPLYELAIEHAVPMLWHAGRTWKNKLHLEQPRITDAGDLTAAWRRYPEAMFIMGHLGGGGDWEWQLRQLRECPGVYVDTSGSVVDDGMIDRAVAAIGHERLLFATDMTMEGGVGKLADAHLTGEQVAAIGYGNMQAILDRRVG
ncbi:MAG: amidohydrolase family protein [Armatimonadetes bacterium]|nr:amidohydrolase family protein [Armatimonadota bacterium]